MKHVTLPRNAAGRDFVLSDVNGCYHDLQMLLSEVNFTAEDRLFLLGNLINKGGHSEKVIEFASRSNVFPLLGSD